MSKQGFSQYFTNTDCTGDVLPAPGQRDCCVGTDDGLSFHDGSSCNLCIYRYVGTQKYT